MPTISSSNRSAATADHLSSMALRVAPACLPVPRAGGAQILGIPQSVVALAQRGPRESPLAMAVAGFPGLVLDDGHERGSLQRQAAEYGLDRVALAYLRGDRSAGGPPGEYVPAVAAQLRHAEQSRPRMLKLELTGPISQALQLTDEHERPLAYDPALREALAQHTVLRARWLHDQIAMSGAGALLCLDEPFLKALSSPFCPLDWEEGADLLARTLVELPGWRGLCTSDAPDWAALVTLPVDLIFFDAYEHSAGLIQAAEAVGNFLERGGALGWGVVPAEPSTVTQERVETLTRRFISTVEYLAAASSLTCERIAGQAFISTSGVLTHLSVDQAARAANLCAEVAVAARSNFGLDRGPGAHVE